jgi:hypothetical protein
MCRVRILLRVGEVHDDVCGGLGSNVGERTYCEVILLRILLIVITVLI